jgi:tyrosine phenol-lyase
MRFQPTVAFEPYRIKSVEPLHRSTRLQRRAAMYEAGYNPFRLRSEDVLIDLLTDSGASAMSAAQWGAMHVGDEAYAGSASFRKFERAAREITGFQHILPVHQGRAAERILFSVMASDGDIIPSNSHFDTTRANIEARGAEARDLLTPEGRRPAPDLPFKGDMDLDRLDATMRTRGARRVPLCLLTVTNNAAGGQPVSMANIRAVSEICRRYGVPLFLDACRFAEDAWLIKQREPGYADKSIAAILREMCAQTDGCTMSAKKDALVNIGGFLALNDAALFDEARNLVVVYEGLRTYGGLAGRDMEAMARGIEESVSDAHIRARIGQVEYLGQQLLRQDIPIVLPIGGHAIYLDARRFYGHIPQEEFPAQTLAAELYLDSGVRSMERGIVSAGRDSATGKHHYPKLELVRLAIPRRVYTQAHMDVTAESVIEVYCQRRQARGLRMVYEPKYLRFFQARFEPLT